MIKKLCSLLYSINRISATTQDQSAQKKSHQEKIQKSLQFEDHDEKFITNQNQRLQSTSIEL